MRSSGWTVSFSGIPVKAEVWDISCLGLLLLESIDSEFTGLFFLRGLLGHLLFSIAGESVSGWLGDPVLTGESLWGLAGDFAGTLELLRGWIGDLLWGLSKDLLRRVDLDGELFFSYLFLGRIVEVLSGAVLSEIIGLRLGGGIPNPRSLSEFLGFKTFSSLQPFSRFVAKDKAELPAFLKSLFFMWSFYQEGFVLYFYFKRSSILEWHVRCTTAQRYSLNYFLIKDASDNDILLVLLWIYARYIKGNSQNSTSFQIEKLLYLSQCYAERSLKGIIWIGRPLFKCETAVTKNSKFLYTAQCIFYICICSEIKFRIPKDHSFRMSFDKS